MAGWSYGGAVISDLTDPGRAERLVYIASCPEPAGAGTSDESDDLTGLPGLLLHDNGTVELDTDWWLSSPKAGGRPDEILGHLRETRRRPITRQAWLAAPTAEAWRSVPAAILISRSDQFIPLSSSNGCARSSTTSRSSMATTSCPCGAPTS